MDEAVEAVIADYQVRAAAEEKLHQAQAYRRHVRTAPDMTSVLLPVGNGIELSRFKTD